MVFKCVFPALSGKHASKHIEVVIFILNHGRRNKYQVKVLDSLPSA